MKKIFIFLILLLANLYHSFSHGSEWKFRAREHFEVSKLNSELGSETYQGLNSTINVFNEKPFDLSYGLAFSFAFTRHDQDPLSNDRVQEFSPIRFGFETKYFPKIALDHLFVRGGVGLSYLEAEPIDNLWGANSYGGIGYEFKIGPVGLALEAAARYEYLEAGNSNLSFTPSIGLHFYGN